MNLDWPRAVKAAAKMGTRMAHKIVGVMSEGLEKRDDMGLPATSPAIIPGFVYVIVTG